MKWRFIGKGPAGRNLCRWCGTEVPVGRRNWCSQACVNDYLATKGHQHLVPDVRKRDRGICAQCGLDTEAFRRAWLQIRHELRVPHPLSRWDTSLLQLLGWDLGKRFWEADHIIERHDGGPNTLANLQTLCQLCHKAKTREYAARRARRRKLALQPELF